MVKKLNHKNNRKKKLTTYSYSLTNHLHSHTHYVDNFRIYDNITLFKEEEKIASYINVSIY